MAAEIRRSARISNENNTVQITLPKAKINIQGNNSKINQKANKHKVERNKTKNMDNSKLRPGAANTANKNTENFGPKRYGNQKPI